MSPQSPRNPSEAPEPRHEPARRECRLHGAYSFVGRRRSTVQSPRGFNQKESAMNAWVTSVVLILSSMDPGRQRTRALRGVDCAGALRTRNAPPAAARRARLWAGGAWQHRGLPGMFSRLAAEPRRRTLRTCATGGRCETTSLERVASLRGGAGRRADPRAARRPYRCGRAAGAWRGHRVWRA